MKNKILIIDDDPLVLKSLQNLLIRSGYSVECAKSGEEAEIKLKMGTFGLIISDIRMPKEDGISVVKKLKEICAEQSKSEIPFIFITGYASEESPIDALKLGAKDYILKPFDLDELLKSVRQHIAS